MPIHTSSAKIKRLVAVYNMVPNLLWSIINVTPIYIFCYVYMPVRLVYLFLVASLIGLILPKRFFNSIRLSRTSNAYKKIGVNLINKFTQNGQLVNNLIRKKFPHYNVISAGSLSHKKVLEQTYIFEKFHYALFVFFLLTTFFALEQNKLWWALVISVTNLAYNIYPIFLQQYIRIRLSLFSRNRRMVLAQPS